MNDRKPTVLIADDVPANVEFLTEVLGDDKEILVATTGRQALETAIAQLPDLILLDIIMPDQDGYEICVRLKRESATQNIPVIFVTALNQEQDEARGLEVGAIDYITKPFSPSIVRARVRNQLELKRYRDLLEKLSTTDGLTSIPNRRQFDQTLDREWRRGVRNQSTLALILMDVDGFKAFNDHYGHVAGDDCLRMVAASVAQIARRPGDLAARFGGDEFACLLPETNSGGALMAATRVQENVNNMQIPHAFSTAADHVTISAGLAAMVPVLGQSPSELIKRADERLYAAKQRGRNQVAR
jgi:diguanylate cyclase (GGDEF)-like protein